MTQNLLQKLKVSSKIKEGGWQPSKKFRTMLKIKEENLF
jgi:hypothetical protein